nr:phage tail protein [Photorhabdus heterorhabditis]
MAKSAVPSSRKINGKALNGDVSLSAGDVGAFPRLRSIDEIPTLGYNGPFRGGASVNYAKGVSVGDSDYGQIWVDSSGRLFAQFSNNNGAKHGGECVYMDDITPIEQKANNAVPSSRKINGKALSGDVSLSAGDVGAFSGFIFVNSIPTRGYVGVWGGSKNAGWVKGLNIGTVGGDVGQLYIDPNGNLHAYFLNNNGSVNGGIVTTHPVGSPIPWPKPNPPSDYLTCNGQTFNKSLYPKLAEVYPVGRVPDLRGEFIRGWDDGRGVDLGRVCGSWQGDSIRNITGNFGNPTTESGGSASGAFSYTYRPGGRAQGAGGGSLSFTFDASRVVPTANENRPRNIAFNYIVRAA